MQRNGIHIIDLKKTQNYLQEAIDEIQQLSRAGKTILFVGTKKQSTEIIRNEAVRARYALRNTPLAWRYANQLCYGKKKHITHGRNRTYENRWYV